MSDFKQIQVRRDVSSDWTSINPILASGEPGLETNTGKLKFGDGVTAWNDLPYLTQGVKGDKGDRGYQGTAGLKGDPGNDGAPGATGQTGLPGSTGNTGAKGDKGDTGATGQNGTNGAKGEKGDRGDTGDTGATGSQGIQGIQGVQGDQGDPGTNGTNGTNGTDGLDINWLGAYNGATAYVINDAVSYNGSSYICILASTGNLPTNGTYWDVLAAKGAAGIGSGDMLASVYDPTNKADDAFDQDNMADGMTNKNYTATEKTKLASIETAADVTDATNVSAAGAFMKSVDDTDDITVGATNKFATATEKTKLGHITVTQAVDLDTIETNANNVPGIKTKTDFITVTQAVDLDAIETNANNVPGIKTKTDFITVTQAVDLDTMESDIAGKQPLDADLTALAAAGNSTVLAATTASFLTADETKLDGIEALADVTDAVNIASSIVGVAGKSDPADADTIPLIDSAASNALKELSIADLKLEIGKALYPVGSIYTSVNSTNPNTSMGFGTWTAFGAGRVPVGFDSGQTEFDVDEETGGAKTHTLITAEMPSHTHTQDAHTHTQNAHSHTTTTSLAANGTLIASAAGGANNGAATGVNNATATNQNTTATNQNTGGGGAHNNLQPYIVVRMWKRTA